MHKQLIFEFPLSLVNAVIWDGRWVRLNWLCLLLAPTVPRYQQPRSSLQGQTSASPPPTSSLPRTHTHVQWIHRYAEAHARRDALAVFHTLTLILPFPYLWLSQQDVQVATEHICFHSRHPQRIMGCLSAGERRGNRSSLHWWADTARFSHSNLRVEMQIRLCCVNRNDLISLIWMSVNPEGGLNINKFINYSHTHARCMCRKQRLRLLKLHTHSKCRLAFNLF